MEILWHASTHRHVRHECNKSLTYVWTWFWLFLCSSSLSCWIWPLLRQRVVLPPLSNCWVLLSLNWWVLSLTCELCTFLYTGVRLRMYCCKVVCVCDRVHVCMCVCECMSSSFYCSRKRVRRNCLVRYVLVRAGGVCGPLTEWVWGVQDGWLPCWGVSYGHGWYVSQIAGRKKERSGQEISDYIERGRWEKKRLPGHTNPSFYNWDTNFLASVSSSNCQVLADDLIWAVCYSRKYQTKTWLSLIQHTDLKIMLQGWNLQYGTSVGVLIMLLEARQETMVL